MNDRQWREMHERRMKVARFQAYCWGLMAGVGALVGSAGLLYLSCAISRHLVGGS